MVKTTKLVPTLEFGDYKLLMHNRPSDVYDVMKGYVIIGRIRVVFQYVKANTGTEISYIPYEININIIKSTEKLPIQLFEKIIMATIS